MNDRVVHRGAMHLALALVLTLIVALIYGWQSGLSCGVTTVTFGLAMWLLEAKQARDRERVQRDVRASELLARAGAQHAAWVRGDDRLATYGEHAPRKTLEQMIDDLVSGHTGGLLSGADAARALDLARGVIDERRQAAQQVAQLVRAEAQRNTETDQGCAGHQDQAKLRADLEHYRQAAHSYRKAAEDERRMRLDLAEELRLVSAQRVEPRPPPPRLVDWEGYSMTNKRRTRKAK